MFTETKLFFSQVITSLIPNDDFRGFDPLRPQVKLPPVMLQPQHFVFLFLNLTPLIMYVPAETRVLWAKGSRRPV